MLTDIGPASYRLKIREVLLMAKTVLADIIVLPFTADAASTCKCGF